MAEYAKTHLITIDLSQFKLHVNLRKKIELTLHFNSPSRRFYLSVIALVVNEMKKQGKITSIPLEGHQELLALLNDTVGGSAGSSEKENLLPRIYRKWQHALPNLEEAPLFKVLGRKKEYDESNGKTYPFTETEKDLWANLFEYMGSEENVRLKFAINKIGANLNDVVIVFEDSQNDEAWEKFISSLKKSERKKADLAEEPAEPAIPESAAVQIPPAPERKISWFLRYRWVAVAAILVAVGAITLAVWKTYLKPDSGDVASIKKMAFLLPDEPSIAVLPFVNLSGDPKQEFLCDAMTDAIITALTKVPRLFVIARNSTFAYKGKPVKVKQVSEDLGVQYVLEGGFQRSGDHVRITVQLIDALTGNHLWAERYDRELKDIFALQDEIIIKILSGVRVKLVDGGRVATAETLEKYYKGNRGLDCYLKVMEARGYSERWNIEDNNTARRMFEEAISMCPENPMGYYLLGWVYNRDYQMGNTKSPRETLEKSQELAQKALAMDNSISGVYSLLGIIYAQKGDIDRAIIECERAVALNPGGIGDLVLYAATLTGAGRSEEAILLYQKAIRLNPFGPSYLFRNFGDALRNTERFEEAVSAYKKAIQIAPDNFLAHVGLAIAYSLMGREEEAHAEAEEILRLNPKFSLEVAAKVLPISPKNRDCFIDALGKAGLK